MSRRLSQEEFEEKFYKMYRGRLTIVGRYETATTPIKIECNNCHFPFERTPNALDRGRSICPICNVNGDNRKVFDGINDIWSVNPSVAKWLLDPEDGHHYRFNTNTRLKFVCPDCHKVSSNIPRAHKNGFVCPYCSDGISYPNKLMANLLDELHIAFIPEYHFVGSNYRYDFYFEFDSSKYVVEMDGGFGHGNFETKGMSIEDQIKRDHEKDILAENNGCTVIRIDCNYGNVENRKEYIKRNIQKSLLNSLFMISDELFDDADKNASIKQYMQFASLWNDGIHSYDILMKKLHVTTRGAVRGYAKACIQLTLISGTYEDFLKEVRLASNAKLAKTKGCPVLCEQTRQAFVSMSQASREMGLTTLREYFVYNRKYCGKLPDGTKLTWRKLTKEEYEQYKQKGA